jgi:hypothetical protein
MTMCNPLLVFQNYKISIRSLKADAPCPGPNAFVRRSIPRPSFHTVFADLHSGVRIAHLPPLSVLLSGTHSSARIACSKLIRASLSDALPPSRRRLGSGCACAGMDFARWHPTPYSLDLLPGFELPISRHHHF